MVLGPAATARAQFPEGDPAQVFPAETGLVQQAAHLAAGEAMPLDDLSNFA